jgi:hypothetical protein
LALNAFTADGQVEKQMGMKKKVVSARNGIPYMQVELGRVAALHHRSSTFHQIR